MKKIFSVLLMICLSFTLIPVSMFAGDDEWTVVSSYSAFKTAVNTNDVKIKLGGNIDDLSKSLFLEDNKIILDLNGHVITLKDITCLDNCEVKIVDTSSSKNGKINSKIDLASRSAKFTLEAGEINYIYDSAYCSELIINGGEITIKSLVAAKIHANSGKIVIDDKINITNSINPIFVTDEGKNGSTISGTIYGGTLYGTIKGDYTISGNTVTYKTGNDTYARQVVENGNSATKPITPSKDNYAFVGWFIDENCTTPYDFKTKVNDDITLYAGYSPATITFDTKGGTTVDPITQEYGTEITKPSNPTKKGYIFDGWDTTIPSTMPANNMTISAKWAECISHELVELVNDETLKEKATCSSKAIYYKSCKKCGYTSEETFEYGDYGAHNNLIHIDRKAPTTEIEGNIEYYYCDTCKKCFSDIEGLNEISKESTVLNKITPSSNKVVTCEEYIHSKDWTWSESKKACVYKVSNTYAK